MDHLKDLGVNAVELLPVFEYDELEFQRRWGLVQPTGDSASVCWRCTGGRGGGTLVWRNRKLSKVQHLGRPAVCMRHDACSGGNSMRWQICRPDLLSVHHYAAHAAPTRGTT